MTTATLIKERKQSIGMVYSFRGLVHYRHGGKHGGWCAGRHGAGERAKTSIS